MLMFSNFKNIKYVDANYVSMSTMHTHKPILLFILNMVHQAVYWFRGMVILIVRLQHIL